MKTKIFYGNQYVGNIQVGTNIITKKIKFLNKVKDITKRVLVTSAITLGVAWVAVGALHLGMANAKTVEVEKEVVKEVRVKAPIMEKILKCESGGTHIDPKTGQVLMRANTNGSIDTGLYQINSVWHKKATELGFDITKEEDNEAMAYWIYENRGTEDWYSSKSCWAK